MQIAEPKWKYRDFFDEVDAMIPPWRPPNVMNDITTSNSESPMIYPENAPSQRMMHTLLYAPYAIPEQAIEAGQALTPGNSGHWTTEFSMPFVLYVRAMDPAGKIETLQIKSCQNPSDDKTGYDHKIIAQKRRQGWLICERATTAQALGITFDTNGLGDAQYGEYLRVEWLRRRRARALSDEREREKMQSDADKNMIAQQKKQTEILEQQGDMTRAMVAEMVSTLIPEITRAVMAGVAGNSNAKR